MIRLDGQLTELNRVARGFEDEAVISGFIWARRVQTESSLGSFAILSASYRIRGIPGCLRPRPGNRDKYM